VEVGFIGPHVDAEGVVRFSSMEELAKVFIPSKERLSVMVYAEGYPVSRFPVRSEKTVDMVRVIIWKRNLDEGVEYVRTLVEKGYEVGVQLARTDQFDLSEIGDAVKRFNDIHPTAVYLVDSHGTFTMDKMMKYAKIYDEVLADDILFGFHAHNNMQQAFTNAVVLCERDWKHDLILDASVMGMGLGAGNLNLELILNYLNAKFNQHYDITPVVQAADRFIAKYIHVCPWGYSVPYFLSAITGRNPRYVNYLIEKHVSIENMEKIFKDMRSNDEGIRYDTEMCDRLIHKYCKE
jgi:4-hydroxy 2-oxovalerate aldolase